MNKKKVIKFLIVFISSFALFFGLTYFANSVLSAYDVTSVRLSPVLNPILGIAFGWPAIIGCATANLLSDILSGYLPFVYIFGFFIQILYGALPYYIWTLIVRSKSHITRLDSPKRTIYFVLLMLVNSAIMGLFVGLFQLYTSGDQFFNTFIFAFLNDFDICVVIGLPLMTLIDFVYSKYHIVRKRKLSFNERIIALSGILHLLAFFVIAFVFLIINKDVYNAQVWKNIFMYSIFAMNIILLISIGAMYLFAYLKKKNAKLRIFEKANGTIFVDENKHIEFLSYPSDSLENTVKSTKFKNSFDSIRNNYKPRYENVWEIMLSNQKGCPMKCSFCDCPGYGFSGNVSKEEFIYQVETIIDNVEVTHTNEFVVNFMRMGEPTLNENILSFIENDLRKIVLDKIDAEKIYPFLSTMLPKNNKEKVLKFILDYCRIKNEVYDGHAGLQFSINTTDENSRKKMFKNMSMSLEEISQIAKLLPKPKGLKYALNFAVTKDTIIDSDILDKLFDKEKFLIKITPIHETFNAIDNGFVITSEYDSYAVYKKFEDDLLSKGWDVMVYLDRKENDNDSLTCGNLLLSNISEKSKLRASKKKKIGLCVAIEIDAIFRMYPNYKELETNDSFKIYYIENEYYDMYVIKTGMGEVAAAAGTQYLIAKYDVSIIINFGVVGGLTKEMKKQKVCLVKNVVHYKYDCSEFMDLEVGQLPEHDSIYIKTNEKLVDSVLALRDDIKVATCCSGDKFVATVEEKESLNKKFGGDICDMESSGIVLTCEINKIPCLLFKAVADGLSDGAEGYYKELEKASLSCLKIADKIVEKISRIE